MPQQNNKRVVPTGPMEGIPTIEDFRIEESPAPTPRCSSG